MARLDKFAGPATNTQIHLAVVESVRLNKQGRQKLYRQTLPVRLERRMQYAGERREV